jgi:hypothetical protein
LIDFCWSENDDGNIDANQEIFVTMSEIKKGINANKNFNDWMLVPILISSQQRIRRRLNTFLVRLFAI